MQAYRHAKAARRLAARVGVVRETCGIAAYQAGEWADALTELRAARRMTGRKSYLPLMADCERALGRPDRALELVTGPQSRGVDRATAIELRIVESGIRRDQGLPEAAVAALQVPELTDGRIRPDLPGCSTPTLTRSWTRGERIRPANGSAGLPGRTSTRRPTPWNDSKSSIP